MIQAHRVHGKIARAKYKGHEYTIAELAKLAGISRTAMYERIRRGLSVSAAVETPLPRRYES